MVQLDNSKYDENNVFILIRGIFRITKDMSIVIVDIIYWYRFKLYNIKTKVSNTWKYEKKMVQLHNDGCLQFKMWWKLEYVVL